MLYYIFQMGKCYMQMIQLNLNMWMHHTECMLLILLIWLHMCLLGKQSIEW